MPSLKQPSFSGGLISPQLLGLTDQAKYVRGLRTCTNAMIQRFGGVQNRPGTFYDDTLRTGGAERLIKFVFNYANAYQLVFSDLQLWIYKDNERISVVGAAAYAGGTTYAIGDLVTYGGLVYRSLVAGNIGHQPDISATQWDVQTGGVLKIKTTIPQASLSLLCAASVNDIMTITEQGFYPQQLRRYSDTKWAIANIVTGPDIQPPTGLSTVAGRPVSISSGPQSVAAAGGNAALPKDQYIVLAIGTGLVPAIVPSASAISTVGGADGANIVTITWTSATGSVYRYEIYKLVATNYRKIGGVGSATFTFPDNGIVPTTLLELGSDAIVQYDYVVTSVSDASGSESLASVVTSVTGLYIDSTYPNVITWGAVAGASMYRIYRVVSGVGGYLGSSTVASFSDTNILRDPTIQPPEELPLFATTSDYPAICCYYQQRLLLANTINQPQTVICTQVGSLTNFNVTAPIVDTAAFQFVVVSDESQPITALVDLGKLIIHTAGAEFMVNGNAYGTMTPSACAPVRQSKFGARQIKPVIVGDSDVYIQTRGSVARDLKYDIQSFGFTGKDLSIFASSLFAGRQIIDMDWQQIPDSVIWTVLDNGQLLGMTYVREHDIWAWHLQSFENGSVEAVCVVPLGTEDVCNLIINRTINGVAVRYFEHFAVREYLDTVLLSDAMFCDCALVYDGRNAGSTTMTATTGGGWTPSDLLTMTASVVYFNAGDIGNAIVFQKLDPITDLVTDQITFDIIGFTSTTVVSVVPQGTVPTWARVALTTWGKAVDEFSGMGHLEGESISVLADGNVVASPFNLLPNGDPRYPAIIVTAGAFTLDEPALVVTAGLPIQMDVQTLPVENAQGETVMGKYVTVKECCPIFFNSRGGSYGQDQYHLTPWKQPLTMPPIIPIGGFPVQPWTGPAVIGIAGSQQLTGQLWVRQTDPVPWAMSGVVVLAVTGT